MSEALSGPRIDAVLQEALDVVSDGIAVFDARDRCLMWNARYARVWANWGVPLTVGASFADLLRAGARAGRYPEAEANVEAWVGAQIQRRSHGLVEDIRDEFGERLRFETRRTPSGGFVTTCSAAPRDSRPLAGQGFLDTVVENVPAMLIVKHGETGRFLLVNRVAEEMLGVPKAELLGKNDRDFLPAEQAEQFAADDRRVVESGELVTIDEEPLDTPGGRRWMHTHKIAVPFEDGHRHLLVISEDITERKASAAALEDALKRAEAGSIAKSEFLANMSHEIRTPLNGVIGMAEVLSRTQLDDQQRDMMQVILVSGQALNLLLSDILDLSKIEAGAVEIAEEPINLREAVSSAVAVFDAVAREKGVGFNLGFAEGFHDHVRGDALRIRQIIANLASNAVKFTKAGEVNINALTRFAPDGRVIATVTIQDTGTGFEKTAGERLFERFQQADGSVTRKFGGSGLGLPIARKLARLMGGDITCSAELGEGATFVFEAILAPGRPAVVDTPAPPPQGVAGRRLRMLLAEDHPTNQKVIALMLRDLADLTIVEDGQAAVEAFEKADYDIVLMDTHMPVLDGLGAMSAIRARELRLNLPRTPIISLTANAMPHQVSACLAAGADFHLAKPVSIQALITGLNTALEGPAAGGDAGGPLTAIG
jgi:PAS domain S-box-containing protein